MTRATPTRVLLVVTGDLEELALARALNNVFPAVEFRVKKELGFTSGRLPPVDPAATSSKADTIVARLLSAMTPEAPGEQPFDYAIAFDDVELENDRLDEPPDTGVKHILDHVGHAIDLVLRPPAAPAPVPVIPKGYAKMAPPLPTLAEKRAFLRDRCSFHLFRVLIEALFFGDPNGVQNVAGPGVRFPAVQFDATVADVEAFITDDADYLAPPKEWRAPGARHSAVWATDNRRRHPKHYLEYLLDPDGAVRRPYKEKEHGVRALSALSWKHVVAPAAHARMVRAALDDLADMAGVTLPWLGSQRHPLTCRKPAGRLRNVI